MIANWLYNRIRTSDNEERENMNLDVVLEQVGCGTPLTLRDAAPEATMIIREKPFYIKPSVTDVNVKLNSKILLFSAPGATGKSALAKYIAYSKNALLWDLSKDRIANHSFTGMLVDTLGPDMFSTFTGGLLDGTSVLVIDALDEAEMISGRVALETLLADIRTFVKEASTPNVVLCARTETAHYVKEFYAHENQSLPVAHYEIGFFEDTNAIEFLEKKISEKKALTPVIKEWIETQFNEIKRLIGEDQHAIRSFLGYAPVLEALAVFFDEDAGENTMKALQNISVEGGSTAIFVSIMDYILKREQSKVINGFRKRCSKDFPDFKGWDDVYRIEEQLARIADYIVYEAFDFDSFILPQLPHELQGEYKECITPFLKDHPFMQSTEQVGGVCVDFTGAAFRDYVLARLMVSGKYENYATEYFSTHKHNVRFPSQLFFDFYFHYANNAMRAGHFSYLYDGFKAKERANMVSRIEIEEAEGETICVFAHRSLSKNGSSASFPFQADMSSGTISITQANNLYVDISGDVILGDGSEDVIISNSTIKCNRFIINTPNIMILGEPDGATLLSSNQKLDASRYPGVKFEIRSENDCLKIAIPDAAQWYKLRPFECSLDDPDNVDIIKFENAVKTILKHFRKHGKDAPGRHYEFIQNVIIGGSALKQNVLNFLIKQGIIYKDTKDTKQFKLNNEKLERFGVNWGQISQNAIPDFKELFRAYSEEQG